MAITYADYLFWKELKKRGSLLPFNPRVLELGRANWYGDVDIEILAKNFPNTELAVELEAARDDKFAVARIFYKWILNYRSVTAIDLHAPPADDTISHNLNLPIPLEWGFHGRFDVVINNGTGEHVFDQRLFFHTAHLMTALDGIMVHSSPCWGWPDHGFVCHQPTLFLDLAAENKYELLAWWWADMSPGVARVVEIRNAEAFRQFAKKEGTGKDSMNFFALRKKYDAPFRVPVQGVYSDGATEELSKSWQERG